jgi:hypothetical protein
MRSLLFASLPASLTASLTASLLLTAAGCGNVNKSEIELGDVSLGQQLIDLKRALDEDALSADEYQDAKAMLLSTADICGDNGEDEDDD